MAKQGSVGPSISGDQFHYQWAPDNSSVFDVLLPPFEVAIQFPVES